MVAHLGSWKGVSVASGAARMLRRKHTPRPNWATTTHTVAESEQRKVRAAAKHSLARSPSRPASSHQQDPQAPREGGKGGCANANIAKSYTC